MARIVLTPEEIQTAEQIIGHQFADPALLDQSLTHASLADSRLASNERMEFLGDAVLGFVVCDYLYGNFEDALEGEMTKIKSSAVSRRLCGIVAQEIGLGELIQTGKGMDRRAMMPASVIAAVYESVIGAIYLDGGLEAARAFILKHLERHIHQAADSDHQSNFKSVLQQTAQHLFGETPQYVMLDEKGPDHAKCFEICVEIGSRHFGSCWGPSKKQAEQQAALQALVELDLAEETDGGDIVLKKQEEVETELSNTPTLKP